MSNAFITYTIESIIDNQTGEPLQVQFYEDEEFLKYEVEEMFMDMAGYTYVGALRVPRKLNIPK